MAQLCLGQIVLELSPVNVVIGGVPVGESIEQNSVEWESPVGRRFRKRMILPLSPVVDRTASCLISVDIVC